MALVLQASGLGFYALRTRQPAARPDQLWLAGISCTPSAAGLLYLSIALDIWSRRVTGWAAAPS